MPRLPRRSAPRTMPRYYGSSFFSFPSFLRNPPRRDRDSRSTSLRKSMRDRGRPSRAAEYVAASLAVQHAMENYGGPEPPDANYSRRFTANMTERDEIARPTVITRQIASRNRCSDASRDTAQFFFPPYETRLTRFLSPAGSALCAIFFFSERNSSITCEISFSFANRPVFRIDFQHVPEAACKVVALHTVSGRERERDREKQKEKESTFNLAFPVFRLRRFAARVLPRFFAPERCAHAALAKFPPRGEPLLDDARSWRSPRVPVADKRGRHSGIRSVPLAISERRLPARPAFLSATLPARSTTIP